MVAFRQKFVSAFSQIFLFYVFFSGKFFRRLFDGKNLGFGQKAQTAHKRNQKAFSFMQKERRSYTYGEPCGNQHYESFAVHTNGLVFFSLSACPFNVICSKNGNPLGVVSPWCVQMYWHVSAAIVFICSRKRNHQGDDGFVLIKITFAGLAFQPNPIDICNVFFHDFFWVPWLCLGI